MSEETARNRFMVINAVRVVGRDRWWRWAC